MLYGKRIISTEAESNCRRCGVSYRTSHWICAESDMNSQQYSNFRIFQEKKVSVNKIYYRLDLFQNLLQILIRCIIRKTVQAFYDRCEYPTVAKLRVCFIEKKLFFLGSHFVIILKSLEFTYIMCNDSLEILNGK